MKTISRPKLAILAIILIKDKAVALPL